MRTFCFIGISISLLIMIISLILFIYSLIKKQSPCKVSLYALFFNTGNLIFQIFNLLLKHTVIK